MKKEKIRVLRVIARLNIGGPAIQAITLSGKLLEDRFETRLICGTVSPGEGDMSYLAKPLGVRPLVVKTLGREISPIDDIKTLFSLLRLIFRFKPHVIHTHTAKAGVLGRIAAISVNALLPAHRRAKMVHTFHGHVFHGYFAPLKTSLFLWTERMLSLFTHQVVAISKLQKKDLCETFRVARCHKTVVIPLGFELDRFRTGNNRRSLRKEIFGDGEKDLFILGIVGRLAPVKDHRLLLDAIKCLKDMKGIEAVRFLVVGDGELKETLMAHVRRLGIEKEVRFTGWIRDMAVVYGSIDALVLTSVNEGTPVALIEAMAAGCPVAATEVGGVPDLLGGPVMRTEKGFRLCQRGLGVEERTPEAVAEAVSYLTKRPEAVKAAAQRAATFVFSRYSFDRLVKEMVCLYDGLIRSCHP